MTSPNRSKRRAALVAVATAISAAGTPAAANPLSPNWSGLYLGVHAGGDWADLEAAHSWNFSDVTAVGGLHLGYNVGLGRFVLGVEGDATYGGAEAAYSIPTASGEFESSWKGSVRGRFGLTFGLSLAYVAAGYAWSEATASEVTIAGVTTESNTTFDGVVYGAGLETFVLPGLSLRIEALRFDYGSQDLSFGSGTSALGDLQLDDTVVRAGVTYHFN